MDSHIILRIPLIPGVNDSEEDLVKFAALIDTFGEGVEAVELLKYNYLAESKYQQLGYEFQGFADEAQSDERMHLFCSLLKQSLNRERKVFFIG